MQHSVVFRYWNLELNLALNPGCYFLALWTWAVYFYVDLKSLKACFFIYKMRIII